MFTKILWASDGSAAADKALPYARSLAEQSGGPLVVVHVVERFAGSRASGLPVHADVAREAGADLVVVGTRGHTALGGLLLGSVTQRLLHIAPCPVLTVPAVSGASAGEAAARGSVSVLSSPA